MVYLHTSLTLLHSVPAFPPKNNMPKGLCSIEAISVNFL